MLDSQLERLSERLDHAEPGRFWLLGLISVINFFGGSCIAAMFLSGLTPLPYVQEFGIAITTGSIGVVGIYGLGSERVFESWKWIIINFVACIALLTIASLIPC